MVCPMKQRKAFDIVQSHLFTNCLQAPLRMIVQGIVGTEKPNIIKIIRSLLYNSSQNEESSLLLFAPTGVATFNIGVSTIHSALQVPIRQMTPLNDHALAKFQEKMIYVQYIIIDEMSLIGLKLMECIDKRLREAFPIDNGIPFEGRSLIIFDDLAQLPSIKDIPIMFQIHMGEIYGANS